MADTMNGRLPFADASTIVRAHQKDSYFGSFYRDLIMDAFTAVKGQRFVNTYPTEIAVLSKALYLSLTTLLGARTLGEEYVDLIYVNRKGKGFPKLLQKIGFIFSYSILPYFITRLMRRFRGIAENDEKRWWAKLLLSYTSVLDVLMNTHIALFYFSGRFYSISKRVFGMRYAFGHNKDLKKLAKSRGDYSFLGIIILLQFGLKGMIFLARRINKLDESHEEASKTRSVGFYNSVSQLENLKTEIENPNGKARSINVDLSDPDELPYIPESSRTCMLCLSPMINPSLAKCGHIFCWDCIVDWVREHPECPLCRQSCKEQNLLPLR